MTRAQLKRILNACEAYHAALLRSANKRATRPSEAAMCRAEAQQLSEAVEALKDSVTDRLTEPH